jgi:hypothetical protein
MSGSEPELLVTQQTTVDYFSEDCSEYDLFKELANRVKKAIGSVGRRLRGVLSRFKYRYLASVFPCW